MQWSDIDFSPPRRTLRQFAVIWLLFFGTLACWQYFYRGRVQLGAGLGVLAAAVGLAGILRPQAIRVVYAAAMVVAFPIGYVVSRVLLAIAYYGVFTPLGLIFRLVRRDALDTRHRSVTTFWQPKPQPKDLASYLRQF